jgi:hypothetical protein
MPCDSKDFAKDKIVRVPTPSRTPPDPGVEVPPPAGEPKDRKMVIPAEPENLATLPKCTLPPAEPGQTNPGAKSDKKQ